MKSIDKYKGINQFGLAYKIMFENDSHAPGSVDRVLMENMVRLNSDTVDYLYSDYTSLKSNYVKGTKPILEQLVGKMIDEKPNESIIERIALFTSQLQDKCPGDLDLLMVGGIEEELIQHGTDWCTDIARVACALFQVAGVPARLVYLVNLDLPYSGHVINEVFRENKWGAVDTTTNVIYLNADNKPASLKELMDNPSLITHNSNGELTPYTNIPQFKAAAITNYYIWDWQKYVYARSKVNDYYRSILEMSEKGWPDGLRWIHGESD
ncbi:MAG: transglutaminase domain-containing protein [Thermoplasmata archaeon]|nr:transglutaminase domain-containing protein [Thermoplasmata archaeon]